MTEFAASCLRRYGHVGSGVDFTMGNGRDTKILAELCDEVYAFDIQEDALTRTKAYLGDVNHVHLLLDSHENFDHYISDFDLGIFNLGYLPQSAHDIKTEAKISVPTIKKAIEHMRVALVVVCYVGHEEGAIEAELIEDYVKELDRYQYNVSCYKMLNKKKAPYVIEIERTPHQSSGK
ncbi:MAG: tRNA (mnm(5)s(2)U34)-methyltransferase [bacterium]